MKSISWLHISDLHACPQEESYGENSIYSKFKKDLTKLLKEKELSPDFVFITGDVMFGNKKNCGSVEDQYKKAADLIEELIGICGVCIENVFIVPGNHDVNNAENMIDEADTLALNADACNEQYINSSMQNSNPLWCRIMKRLGDYQNFIESDLNAIHLLDKKSHLIYAHRREVNGVKIGIAGFNTAWSSRGKGKAEKMEMWLGGEWQIKTLCGELEDTEMKIALSHHPFDWHTDKEASDISNLMQKEFDFHLHGHTHDTWVEEMAWNHRRVVAGALYLPKKEMEKGSGYNLVHLNLSSKKCDVWLRKYDTKGYDWVPLHIFGFSNENGQKDLNMNYLFEKLYPEEIKDDAGYAVDTEVNDKTLNIGGITGFYPERREVTAAQWNELYKSANRSINLLGHSIKGAFTNQVLEKWKDNAFSKDSLVVKVILLNPNNQILHSFIKKQTSDHINEDLKNNIDQTIAAIQNIKISLKDVGGKIGKDSKIQIRVTDRIIYNMINLFDNRGIITLYSQRENIGDNSPTIRIESRETADGKSSEPNSSIIFFQEEFKRYWDTGSHPEELKRKRQYNSSHRIVNHEKHLTQIQKWLEQGEAEKLPAPLMLSIHLTNSCSKVDGRRLCADCTFKNSIGTEKQELEYTKLEAIIADSISMGVRNFELSGGGEPLEYSEIKKLIKLLGEHKKTDDEFKCGLLTNGLFLDEEIRKLIFDTDLFSYIRFHFCEGIQENDLLYAVFCENVKGLIDYKRDKGLASPRIGIKCLLKKGASDRLLSSILHLKETLGDSFQLIDHLQVKPMWGGAKVKPGVADCLDFKNEFFDYLFSNPQEWPQKDIQVELDDYEISPNFTCMLNPIRGIIDPTGKLLICPNHVRAHQKLTISDLCIEGVNISDVWGTEKHHTKIKNIPYEKVCKSPSGCPCRFISYHEILQTKEECSMYTPEGLENFV